MASGPTHLLSQIFLLFRCVSKKADILTSESYSGEREWPLRAGFFSHDVILHDARGLSSLGPLCQTFVDFSFFVDMDWPVRAIGRVRLGQIDLRNHGVIGTLSENY